ncbi:hypothetical protein L596_020434 [Steinernema carpocapsae]|uniref:G-protein coupled receptors family 1 profile domain-containing protein n=1 Tax=Steinernema carpocapsae TaxID=34508 RepID=A0A4U5MTI9_STECR|nr:hypothetical protein L596_020434 [Steinernema carpocapsae]
MELYLFRNDEFNRLYNCSYYTQEEWRSLGQPNYLLGVLSILVGTIFYLTYLLCLTVMVKSKLLKINAYKLMFYLGFYDMGPIFINGLANGIFFINGDVGCNGLVLKYIMGMCGLYSWMVQTIATVLLALNRLIEMCELRSLKPLFEGNKLYFWLLGTQVYGTLWFFFGKASFFNSRGYSWFFDPYYKMESLEFIDRSQYKTTEFVIHNFTIGTVLPLIYTAVLISLWLKARKGGAKTSRLQALITLQAFIICSTVMCSSISYAVMNVIDVSETYGLISSAAWMLNSGLPSVIYLTMNKTIREGAWQLLKCDKVAQFKNSSKSDRHLSRLVGAGELTASGVGPVAVVGGEAETCDGEDKDGNKKMYG